MKVTLKLIWSLVCFLSFNSFFAQNETENFPFLPQIKNQYLLKKTTFKSDDAKDFYIEKQFIDKKTGIKHVYVGQRYQGIKIKDAVSSLALRGDEVLYFANGFIPETSTKINTVTPSVTPLKSIETVMSHFKLQHAISSKLIKSKNNEYVFDKSGISQDEIPVNLRYVLANDKLILSWIVEVYTDDRQHKWRVTVDATTNEIIEKQDLILKCDFGIPTVKHNDKHAEQHETETPYFLNINSSNITTSAQYKVFPSPIESPNHGSRILVTDPWSAASPYGWHDTDGIVGAEYTTTRGNNVYAYEDIANLNTPGFSPDGGSNLNFDFTLDFNQSPSSNTTTAQNLSSSITNLFYWSNIMHDVWYNYGFDEAAGNFQENNYGNGGEGSDSVNAEALDGSGTNNANFSTPSDGFNPRMQMYLWGSTSATSTLSINSPGGIVGDYNVVLANFGGSLSSSLTADLVLVDDGTALPSLGCNALMNDLSGKIAVIDRGTCNFSVKAYHAQNAGAIAVIVVNNSTAAPFAMASGTNSELVTIPCVMISQSDGNLIKVELPTVNGTLNAATVTYPRDSSFDNGIVAHEYGHGISSRLSSLGNQEQMGEGWSDWFALIMTMSAADVATKVRGMSTYSVFQPTTGNGIRPYPYTTDMAINSFTYADIATVSVPHGVGSVWATMLWDMTWALIDQYGFDNDLYNGTGGNNIAMHLVIEGLKLQPYSPGFIDGRDAILAADEILYNGQNKCLIWSVFANRGLGNSASQGSNNSVTDGTEAFDVPDAYATGTITRSFCGTDVLNVHFSNLTNAAISQIEYTIDVDGTPYNATEIANVPSCSATSISFEFSGLSKGPHLVTFTGTNPVSTAKSFLINSNNSGTTNEINTFESEIDNLVAFDENSTTTTWQRGTAAGTTLSDTVAGGSKVYGTNLAGIHGNSQTYYLVSQCYDLSNLQNTMIKFDMAFDIEIDYDVLYMQYSTDNGVTWNVLGNSTDPDWYNSSTTTCENCIGGQWTGEAANTTTHSDGGINGQMHNYKHSLSAFDASGSAETNILFRFKFKSDQGLAYEGAIIDNFVVESNQVSLSLMDNEFNSLDIYPNPIDDSITIQSTDNLINATIQLYDILGREVNQNINWNTINTNKLAIEMGALAKGTYLIKIKTNDYQTTRKIIKK
jgi:extracellular elastinolytic metalloproteinase